MLDLTTRAQDFANEVAKATALPKPKIDLAGSLAALQPGSEAAQDRAADRRQSQIQLLALIKAIERDDQLRPLARAITIGNQIAEVVGRDVKSLRSLVEYWHRSGKLADGHTYDSLRRCYTVSQNTALHEEPFAEGLGLASIQALSEPKAIAIPGIIDAVRAMIEVSNRVPVQHRRVVALINEMSPAKQPKKSKIQPLPLPGTMADLPANVIPLEGARRQRVLRSLTRRDFEDVGAALVSFIQAGDPKAIAFGRAIAQALPAAA